MTRVSDLSEQNILRSLCESKPHCRLLMKVVINMQCLQGESEIGFFPLIWKIETGPDQMAIEVKVFSLRR